MKILIVEVNWLGDVLFSTPAIKALRKRFPDSYIACLIVPRVKEILGYNPRINEIIINDEDGIHKGFWGKIKLARELKEKRFDMAILFHRSFTKAAITYWAGIPQRIGYATWKRWFLLTRGVRLPKKDSLHRVDYYLNILEPLGCDIKDKSYEFFNAEEDDKFAEDFLRQEGIAAGDFAVCLNPGGNWLPKRWPKEHYAYLADRLISEYQAKVILSGSHSDALLAKEIAGLMKNNPVIAAGRMTLKQSACLFKKVNVMVSADSGPLHIAASIGANSIALFGPTAHLITGPIGRGKIKVLHKNINCRIPCYDKNCADYRCMREITVDEVLSAIKEFLPSRKI